MDDITIIDSWSDGLLAVRLRAYQTRTLAQTATSLVGRSPQTTGTEALAITSVFDDAIWTHATPGMLRRWIFALNDLERDALPAPSDVYLHNDTLWPTLEAAAVFLDDMGVEPPRSELWGSLVDEIGRMGQTDEVDGRDETDELEPIDLAEQDTRLRRNAGPTGDGPIAHFDNIHSYDDLYLAQYQYLRDKRGSDTLAPPTGVTGSTIPIPRTLNSDVLQLAAYWTDALIHTQHEMGYDAAFSRWQRTVADVTENTRDKPPADVYAKNNEFWRDLQYIAIQVAVSDEAPTTWDMVVGSVVDSAKKLPETLGKAAHATAAAAEGLGQTVGDLGKGLLEGLSTPLLVGAGLLGLYFVTRRGRDDKDAA